MELKSVAQALVTAIEQGDLDGLASLYASNAVQHHPLAGDPVEGREAIRESEHALFRAFPDAKLITRRMLANDATVIVELVLTATNLGPLELGPGQELPPTGHRIEVPSVWVLEIDHDGLIAEERDYFDSAVLFRQLGLQG